MFSREEDRKIKDALSSLKRADPPAGYWAGYWPRLKARLDRPAPAAGTGFLLRWGLPALASLAVLAGGYWWGARSRPAPEGFSSPHLRLASDAGEDRAQRVFQEMLELFPKQLSWIYVADGQMDFGVSSAPFAEDRPLVPLRVSAPRGEEAFEARLLLRAGQEISLKRPWPGEAEVLVRVQLDAAGENAAVSLRLKDEEGFAGLEGAAPLSGEVPVSLGRFRWKGGWVPVEVSRPAPSDGRPAAEKREPRDAARTL